MPGTPAGNADGLRTAPCDGVVDQDGPGCRRRFAILAPLGVVRRRAGHGQPRAALP